jgi:hypothetical protein
MANQPVYSKGKDVLVFVNGIAVGCDKTATIEITTKTADVTSKCSTDANGNLWDGAVAIANGWKVTGNGLTVLGQGESGGMIEQSTHQLFELQFKQTKVWVSWIRGSKFYGGDAYVTDMKETASAMDVAVYDYVFTGTGPIFEIQPS